jgi:crotonobetainyl-CoA:carnitine CoA-transferase CaiB-like acyl-CoA transferase
VRLGSGHPNIVPYQAFDAADGAVVLAVGNDSQFAKLCTVLGIPERATDERYSTNAARVHNRVELVAELQGLTSAWTRSELLAACASVGVPATAVLTLPEALRDVQTVSRRSIVSGNHASIGELDMIASPLWHVSRPDGTRASEVPGRGEAAVPPRMGEHTRRVLSLDLALTEGEIDALLAEGVIGTVA